MGKFASSKTAAPRRKLAKEAAAIAAGIKPIEPETPTKSAVIAPAAAAKKPSALLKRTTFKAKSVKPVTVVPNYAIPTGKRAIAAVPRTPTQKPDTAKPKKSKAIEKIVIKTNAVSIPAAVAVARHIPKKEKIQNRHDKLMRKFDSALEARRSVQLKAKSSRKLQRKEQQTKKLTQVSPAKAKAVQTALSDFDSLKNALPSLDDALPSLNSLFRLKSSNQRTGVPKFDAMAKKTAAAAAEAVAKGETGGVVRKRSKTAATQDKKKQFMKRFNHFEKVLNDRSFQQNPRDVIAQHIRMRQEEQQS